MQPVADRVPRRVISVVCGFVFVVLWIVCAPTLRAQMTVPDSQPLNVQLELKRSDAQQAALLDLLQAQQTPGSPQYRKWLTPEQFAERYAPDAGVRGAASDWLQQRGFQVHGTARNGMRVAFSGTAAQLRGTFGTRLEMRVAGSAATVAMVRGSRVDLPTASAAKAVRLANTDPDGIAALSEVVNANAQAAVLVRPPTDGVQADAWEELLAEAAAQGITVLQVDRGASDGGAAGVAVFASAPAAAQSGDAAVSRPDWQAAVGLPANGLRVVPDATLADAATLVQALNTLAVQHGRVGALAPQMYRLASGHGIFTHSDGSVEAGTWTAADGLGTVNVPALMHALVTGTTGVNVALATSNTTVTHGQSLGLAYTVTGTGGTPTGTVTATLKGRSGGTVTLGPASLNASGVANFTTSVLSGDVYDVSGSYSGDTTFAAGTSNTVTATISPENVKLSATGPATPAGAVIPVTVTATAASGVGVPSGAVTVTAYTSAIPTTYTGTLSSSSTNTTSAVVNVPATSVGKLSLLANCTSNGSFACNQPTSLDVTVTTATPTVTLTSTAEPLASNSATQKYDLAVTVAGTASGTAAAPTGTVTLQNNGTAIATIPLTKSAATYTVSLSGTGNSLTAVYNGDTNYASASSAAVVVNAPLIPTMTSLAASPISITFGSGTSLTASVTPGTYAASGAPTGTITYKSNLQGTIGTATLANGYVTYTLATLQVGTHTITATYGGDSSYSTSASSPVTVTVAQGKASTTTALTISPQAPLAEQPTTFSATVMPSFNVPAGTPTPSVICTGQVTFFSNNVFVANGTLSGGTVSVTSKLPAGNDVLTAVYGGDTQCYGSTSPALAVVTTRVASAITLQPSVGYANAGQTIQLTATLAGAGTMAGVPSGTVTFYDLRGTSQVTLATVTLTATGTGTSVAATNVYGSTAGPHNFSAVYSGDGIFLPATSSTQLVNFGDFNLSFNPGSLTISSGGSGNAAANLSVSNGFSGSVTLNCMPPGGSQISCAFQPSTVMAGGSAGLTVGTVGQSGKIIRASRTPMLAEAGATLAALLFLPFRRTRRFATILLLLCCVSLAAGGCGLGIVDSTNNLNSGGSGSGTTAGGGTSTTGTPLGTQFLTVTAVSSDGTLRHTYTFPVTVQ